MKIINLFTKYFLALMLIQGFVLVIVDSIGLEKAGMNRASSKAKAIGKSIIVLGIVLYLLRWIVIR